MMALMGVVLWVADRRAGRGRATSEVVSLRDALLIGLAQALAIVPGTSRSGATISMALFLGHRREAAARFSFLLALPITFGRGPREGAAPLPGGRRHRPGGRRGCWPPPVSGFLAIRLLLAYVRTRDYPPFVVYRFAFALLVWGCSLVRRAQLG